MTPQAMEFLHTIEQRGMHSIYTPARMLKVRVNWTARDGSRGHTDCLAPTTLEAIKLMRDRLPGAVVGAMVLR